MHELEFLPAWYHQTRRRKRVVAIETWSLIGLIACCGAWFGLAQRDVSAKQLVLDGLQARLVQMHTEQNMLNEQLKLRQDLKDREELIASLGLPIEMTRMLQALDSVMPKEMSLVEFDCTTEETARPVTTVVGIRAVGDKEVKQTDRRLKVKVLGVAPSNMDLANFYQGLNNVPFFEQVVVGTWKDKIESGHVMLEFEISFSMNLNQQTGN